MKCACRPAQALVFLACCMVALSAPAAHLDLRVELDPASRHFSATAELIAPPAYSFALHRSLNVHRATADGKPVPVDVRRTGEHRQWRIAARAGAKVRIEYGGTLPALEAQLDHRAILDVRTPMAAADGSFLPSSADWYPRPAAMFSYTVQVAVPAGQRALVPGRLLEEDTSADGDGRYFARFEFAQPSAGIDLMAGPYAVREQLLPRTGGDPIRLRTYFYRDFEMPAQGYLDDSARYIEAYSREIGAYPFDEFSIVASPLPAGFGMPGLTYIGARVLQLPFIRNTSLRHEVLHNWWGNGVYVDYASGNWSEGLTTLMADYAYRESQSAAAARGMRLSWLRDFAAVPGGAAIPLSAFRSRRHGAEAAAGYGKSAMVFLMLREAIGEDAFRRGLRRLWQTRQFRRSSWHDLQQAFEATSGRSLAGYFDQWVQRAGAPAIEVHAARSRASNGKVALTLNFAQRTPAYTLDIPVSIAGAGTAETRRIPLSRQAETVTLALDFAPEHVRIDPDLRVWRMLFTEELPPILRQWIIARAPRMLIAARDADTRRAAQTVARAFFETTPLLVDRPGGSREPLLLIGLHGEIDAALARLDLPPRPAALESKNGSAQVWTVEGGRRRTPVAVVSARDDEALQRLARPLPHYGAQSFLAFDGARVIERGIWPGESPAIPVAPAR